MSCYMALFWECFGSMREVDATDGLLLGGRPATSGSAMWDLLDSRAVGFRETAASGRDTARQASAAAMSTAATAASLTVTAASSTASTSTAPLRCELKGNAFGQALS
eukprot:6213653-Pleurochrysis_carterae.AAC.1